MYEIVFLLPLFPFTPNIKCIDKSQLYITTFKLQKSEHHPMTLHCPWGERLVPFNDLQGSWQKYNFIIVFICRLSMVYGDVCGCQVDKGWIVTSSFMCQLDKL